AEERRAAEEHERRLGEGEARARREDRGDRVGAADLWPQQHRLHRLAAERRRRRQLVHGRTRLADPIEPPEPETVRRQGRPPAEGVTRVDEQLAPDRGRDDRGEVRETPDVLGQPDGTDQPDQQRGSRHDGREAEGARHARLIAIDAAADKAGSGDGVTSPRNRGRSDAHAAPTAADGGRLTARVRASTSRTVRLSVIVPALEEAAALPATLANVRAAARDLHELIVVDGGSRDATRAVAARWADRVLASATGRARQMNAGAAAASG